MIGINYLTQLNKISTFHQKKHPYESRKILEIQNCMFFLLFWCFLTPSVKAQNKGLDEGAASKVNALMVDDSSIGLSDKIDLLNSIGYEYLESDPAKTIKTCEETMLLAEKINYQEGYAKANNILGIAYWMQGDYNKSLKFQLVSLEKYQKIDDKLGIANSLIGIGQVYMELGEYQEAFKQYDHALNIYISQKFQIEAATTFREIAAVLMEQNKNEEAIKYLNNALKIYNDNNYTTGISETHYGLALFYYHKKEFNIAANHVNISIEIANSLNSIYGITKGMILYGKILREQGDYGNAESILKIAVQKAEVNNLKKQILLGYEQLKELKTIANQPALALYYSNKYINLKDSVFNFKKSKELAMLEYDNQSKKSKKKLSNLEDQGKRKNTLYYILILIVTLICGCTCVIYFYSHKRLVYQMDLTKQNQETIKSQRAKVELEKLKQKDLKQNLELKNKQLTSYTFNYQQKNKCINQLQEIVKNLEKAPAFEKKNLIKELKSQIKENLISDKNWEGFRMFFEETQFGFHAKLTSMHPSLTPNDLKLCSLLRLNLSVKESADILGISSGSLKTSKYRLRKKLNLESKQEIVNYLNSLVSEELSLGDSEIEEIPFKNVSKNLYF